MRLTRQRPFLWMLVVALVVLAVISITRILALRSELKTQVTRQVEEQVGDMVTSWEEQLVDRLDQWAEDVALDPSDADQLERQLRKREAWFDSLYLWVPPPQVAVTSQPKSVRGTLFFPPYPAAEDTRRILLHPCLARARALSIMSSANPAEMAGMYIEGCQREALPVRMVAATEAATLLHREGRQQEALTALESARLPPDLPIAHGISTGIPPYRLVGHRTQRAEILMALGRMDEALDLLYDTGVQVTRLDATQADGLLPYVRWPILAELEDHGRTKEAERLRVLLSRAERRARAWREIEERLLPRSADQLGDEPRFVYDQYSETPFVLYYRLVRDGEFGVAIVLDQPLLLADFLTQLPRLRDHLVITNAEGAWAAGSREGEPVVLQVPFTRTLGHLRVGVRAGAIRADLRRYGNQWITPLLVTVIFVLVGIAGLIAQIRANNRQYELMERQREFTRRVTHELKTPLAGIRVMAENLELGAWRSEQHREGMAQRIQNEADRLTARVDEILAVGRQRTLPDPRPFDPEEPVLEAIEQWGPRLEGHGMVLTADLHPTAEVYGDPEAIRDAVGCLLDNALKYRRNGSAEPRAWLTLEQDGDEIVIEVADNGIGVPPKMRSSIFEQFVRVEGPNRGMAGGHGLGLAQVAEIVDIHDGAVECTEGVDGGARFTLRLPAHQ